MNPYRRIRWLPIKLPSIRYTGAAVTGRVADFTLQELKAIDIGSRVDPKWDQERVPTVDETFRLCQGKIGIYLDLRLGNRCWKQVWTGFRQITRQN